MEQFTAKPTAYNEPADRLLYEDEIRSVESQMC